MTRALDLAERLAAIVATQQEIVSKDLDLQTVLDTVVVRAQDLAGASGAIIETMHDGELLYKAGSGTATPFVGFHLSIEGSLSGRCVTTGEVLKSDDTETDPRVDREACRALGALSIIVVPLSHKGTPVGVLKVISEKPSRFDELDQYSLQLLAGIIASAMTHATEYQEKVASEKRYRLLFDECLAGAFHSTVDGRFVDCNESLAQMLGYASRQDLLSVPTWDLYFDRQGREAFIADLKSSRSLKDYRLRLKRKDGEPLDARLNVTVMPGGNETFLVGTVLDH
ncbi:MAG: GAF domain-containing protein [Acidobacteriota bacterium]